MNYLGLRWAVGVAVGLGVGALGGCGLISSDVTNFDLTLDKQFTIDATNWKIDTTKATSLFTPDGKLQGLPCGSSPSVCSSAVTAACPMGGCTGTCNMTSNFCELSLDISLSQPVDLSKEQPELQTLNSEPVIKVSIDRVSYDVANNNLTVATPEISVSVGPTTAVSATDAQVKVIGTIPAIPAGFVTMGSQQLMFTPTGKTQLIDIMSHFKTAFNVWAGSSIKITAGQALPMGKLEAVVHVLGHAGV
jgi:hypothetical protein